jgi:hypothetical protein
MVETNFNKALEGANRNCEKTSDCRLDNYHYDPCVPVALNKNYHIQDFFKHRNDVHKTCGYVPKPCAAPFDTVHCIEKRCILGHQLRSRFKEVVFYTTNFKEGTFLINKDTGIRCATAPCPSRQTIHEGKIVDHRFTVALSLLLDNRHMDGLGLVLNGKTFQMLNFDWLVSQLPKEVKIETKPVD